MPNKKIPEEDRYEDVKLGKHTMRLPTNEWAEYLRELFKEHVKPLDPADGWKGACEAFVPRALAADVTEAMNFIGALVDTEEDLAGGDRVRLYSDGYWAHGF